MHYKYTVFTFCLITCFSQQIYSLQYAEFSLGNNYTAQIKWGPTPSSFVTIETLSYNKNPIYQKWTTATIENSENNKVEFFVFRGRDGEKTSGDFPEIYSKNKNVQDKLQQILHERFELFKKQLFTKKSTFAYQALETEKQILQEVKNASTPKSYKQSILKPIIGTCLIISGGYECYNAWRNFYTRDKKKRNKKWAIIHAIVGTMCLGAGCYLMLNRSYCSRPSQKN